mmetsp:Transcript_42631/g.99984  ORF Transcript_42631/g.99984 Transcript_42631/m.99984 type:complete len:334 (+) Transcript_42631:213-1214(+)
MPMAMPSVLLSPPAQPTPSSSGPPHVTPLGGSERAADSASIRPPPGAPPVLPAQPTPVPLTQPTPSGSGPPQRRNSRPAGIYADLDTGDEEDEDTGNDTSSSSECLFSTFRHALQRRLQKELTGDGTGRVLAPSSRARERGLQEAQPRPDQRGVLPRHRRVASGHPVQADAAVRRVPLGECRRATPVSSTPVLAARGMPVAGIPMATTYPPAAGAAYANYSLKGGRGRGRGAVAAAGPSTQMAIGAPPIFHVRMASAPSAMRAASCAQEVGGLLIGAPQPAQPPAQMIPRRHGERGPDRLGPGSRAARACKLCAGIDCSGRWRTAQCPQSLQQ